MWRGKPRGGFETLGNIFGDVEDTEMAQGCAKNGAGF